MDGYVLRGGEAGAERLRLLGRVMWPSTETLLRRVGMVAGLRCLDVGCGIGAVTLELARWTGVTGTVVGLDMDETALAMAHQEALRLGLRVDFRVANVQELAERSVYDLVFSRFLLSHLPDPSRAVKRLAQAVLPGGVVVAEDVDFGGHFCHPPCPAFERYVEWYREAVQHKGGDACLGSRMPDLLEDAGLQDVEVQVVQPVFRRDPGKRLAAVTLEHIREAVLAAGLASSGAVDATVAELEAFASDRRTILSLPRIFQTWGRRGTTE